MTRFIALMLLSTAALATSPTKEPEERATTAEADASAYSGSSSDAKLSAEQSVSFSERSVGIGLGAGSAHYTGSCVVPKKGRNGRTGFLERGFTLPLLRMDPAVEVDEACVAHEREMERLALELEQQRLEIERERLRLETLRLDQCLSCDIGSK